MKSIYRSNLFMLIVVVGQVFGSIFLSRPLQQLFSFNQFLVVTQVLFLLIPVLLYLLATRLPIKETLKLNSISIVDIGIVIVIAIIAQPIASFLSVLSSLYFENTVNEVIKGMGSIPYLTQLFIIALTPAICEEVTMRGIILSGYEKVSMSKAAIVTGLFFGILHMNPQQFLYAFVLGIIFAYLVRITNSLFSTIICHFTFNGIQVTMAYLISKVRPEVLDPSAEITNFSGKEQLISLGLLLLWASVATYIIVRLIKYMGKRHGFLNNGYMRVRTSEQSDVYVEERIINGPFIAVVLVYLILMVLTQLLSNSV